MKYYTSLEDIEKLIQRYTERGGYVVTLVEGSLGYGTTMLYAEPEKKLKTFIIQEHYVNPWSSVNTVRGYNKMPKKYADMLAKIEAEEE